MGKNSTDAEIAFFGGSFTAIDRGYMLSLLDATVPYIDKFKGIRISTRPDCIDDEILSILKLYNVTSIELGAQSMDDVVLEANNRGHDSKSVEEASNLIKSKGFALGLQMMTGLYMSNDNIDMLTARKFIELKPDTVRIYPTVVMNDTYLADLYEKKLYIPQNLTESVTLCSKLITLFESYNIKVIRVGLHHSDSLDKNKIAGPYHPAFRELCESEILYNKVKEKLKNLEITGSDTVVVKVSPSCVSKFIGNKRHNIKRLNESGYKIKVVQDIKAPDMEFILEIRRG